MPDPSVVCAELCEEPPFAVDYWLRVDTEIFSREVILRTCYAFGDVCRFWVKSAGDGAVAVGFGRRDAAADLDTLKGEFGNALIDFALRATIETNTRLVRETIVAAALAEAGGVRPAGR
ncbi:MAG: His-Xaa-Ser system protein HxsD [Rhodospirillaceae bacterium]